MSAEFVSLPFGLLDSTMVEQSDRARLLDWEEIPPPVPTQAVPSSPVKKNASEKTSPPDGRTQGGSAPRTGWGTSSTRGPNVTAVVPGGDVRPARLRVDHSVPGWDIAKSLDADHIGLSVKEQWEEKDQIVAVFVVTFDTRSGKSNMAGRPAVKSYNKVDGCQVHLNRMTVHVVCNTV